MENDKTLEDGTLRNEKVENSDTKHIGGKNTQTNIYQKALNKMEVKAGDDINENLSYGVDLNRNEVYNDTNYYAEDEDEDEQY